MEIKESRKKRREWRTLKDYCRFRERRGGRGRKK